MPAKYYPPNIFDQASKALVIWKDINSQLAFGDLTTENMEQALDEMSALRSQMNTLEAQLTDLRNQRDERSRRLNAMLKRVRAGIKAVYGDDSSEYEMIGGTRLSERKRPSRKQTVALDEPPPTG